MIRKIIWLLLVLVLAGCSFNFDDLNVRSQGALQVAVDDGRAYAVYLDDIYIGQTPYFSERLKAGRYALSLTPVDSPEELIQVQLAINRRSLTVVSYNHNPEPNQRSLEVVYLQSLDDKNQARLSVSTIPDHTVVKVDGQVVGFAPISLTDQPAGEKTISLEAPGYATRTLQAKTIAGYHLIVEAKLGRVAVAETLSQPQVSPDPGIDTPELTPILFGTEEAGVYRGYQQADQVEAKLGQILTATVGIDWLRVRSSPNTFANNQVARVRVGDYFPVLDSDTPGTWTRIEYAPEKSGWVQSEYLDVADQSNQ